MQRILTFLFVAALSFHADAAPKPNIIVVLVDDMGFSDLGCYGGEIPTPNIDALAAGRLRFTQLYNTGRCALHARPAADRTELNDLALQQPERVKLLSAAWEEWARRVGVQPRSLGKSGARKQRQ